MAHLQKKIVMLLVMLALSAGSAAVRADPSADVKTEAKKHYDRAMELNEDGQVAGAVVELKRCYELAPHHTVIFNLGQAYITLGKPVEAVAALQRYLVEGGEAVTADRKKKVERDIARQKTRIATLYFLGLPDGAVVAIDGEDAGRAPLPGPVRVGVGKHIVAATAVGYEAGEARIEVAGEDRKVVELKLALRAAQPSRTNGCVANQVPVLGGTFWMGDPDLAENSKPVHKVTLTPYCIDRTEVTVAAYRLCVRSGGCTAPGGSIDWKKVTAADKAKWNQFCTWGKSGLDQHPINCVDWSQASGYCEWTGGRLPTEAQWEYAARGNDSRKYPWGNEAPDPSRLNACGSECISKVNQLIGDTRNAMYVGDDGWLATASVGSYPKGASPFGVLDMAGNVEEWMADGFAAYSAEPVTNPHMSRPDALSPVIRGGGWLNDNAFESRAANRILRDSSTRSVNLGFRCVRGDKM